MKASGGHAQSGKAGKPIDSVRTIVKGVENFKGREQSRLAYFIVIAGSSIGKLFKLAKSMVIGRSVDCDICLDDEGISRQHAKVEKDDQDNIWIADLGSTNGTYFIDGRRIERHALQDGDKIRIGPASILKLCYHDSLDEDFFRHQYDSATKDGLTGIFNKKYFFEQLKKDFAYAGRHREVLSLIAFDIDHFKKINDTFGHPAGDFILRELTGVVGQALRSEDWFARVGGEEFAIIERAADEKQTWMMAERIRSTVEMHPFMWETSRIPVTISLGVATLRGENPGSAEALVRAADEFLYKAKEAGRNRVASALG